MSKLHSLHAAWDLKQSCSLGFFRDVYFPHKPFEIGTTKLVSSGPPQKTAVQSPLFYTVVPQAKVGGRYDERLLCSSLVN